MLDVELIVDRMIDKRKKLGWTQRDLAVKTGISFEYINKIELKHKFPSLAMLDRLSNALGMTVKEVFRGVDINGSLYMVPEISDNYVSCTKNSRRVFMSTVDGMEEIDCSLKNTKGRIIKEKWL